jgi:hypothetical protein
METALHRLLRKHEFNGQGYVHVVVVGLKSSPIYLVSLGTDAAKVLGEALTPVLGVRIHPSPTNWVLFRTDASAILKASDA